MHSNTQHPNYKMFGRKITYRPSPWMSSLRHRPKKNNVITTRHDDDVDVDQQTYRKIQSQKNLFLHVWFSWKTLTRLPPYLADISKSYNNTSILFSFLNSRYQRISARVNCEPRACIRLPASANTRNHKPKASSLQQRKSLIRTHTISQGRHRHTCTRLLFTGETQCSLSGNELLNEVRTLKLI